jgi:O-antigen/teichoic acid export membrane protein
VWKDLDHLKGLALSVVASEVRTGVWRRIGRNFSISVLGSLVAMAIGLLRSALLTKSLSMDSYGRVLIVINLFAFANMFAGLRVNDVLYRFFEQFRTEGDYGALQGLLWLCLGISLVVGLLIGGGVFVLSPWIASRIYQDPSLASSLRIYAVASLMTVFSGFYRTILRIGDRFAMVVVPQVLGGIVNLAILTIYFTAVGGRQIESVVTAFAVGVFVEALPALARAVYLVRKYLVWCNAKSMLQALNRYRKELVGVLFNTNLAGYLKLAFSPGDVFLLGVFSTPSQVALYGLANQLTRPLLVFQNNLQLAIVPEVTSLWAKKQLVSLQNLVHRYIVIVFLVGSGIVLGMIVAARPLVLLVSGPEYLDALPILQILVVVGWLTILFMIFYPVGLSMDMLKWFNVANALNVIILSLVLLTGQPTALKFAYVQLVATLIRRVLAHGYVWLRLRASVDSLRSSR